MIERWFRLRLLCSARGGGVAIEYGLIAALMVIVLLIALVAVADATNGKWTLIQNEVAAATA